MNYLEIFYNIIFHPKETFRDFPEQKSNKLAFLIVFLISIFFFISTNINLHFQFGTFLNFLFSTIGIYAILLLWASFINFLAQIFNYENRFNKLILLMSFSLIPWIFLAPINLLNNINQYGTTIGSIFLLVIWVYSIYLQILAISETYQIPRKNAVLILFVPFIGSVLNILLLSDFFSKFIHLTTF